MTKTKLKVCNKKKLYTCNSLKQGIYILFSTLKFLYLLTYFLFNISTYLKSSTLYSKYIYVHKGQDFKNSQQ